MKQRIVIAHFLLLIIVSIPVSAQVSLKQTETAITTTKRPKNIIFMVGDGMGLTQLSAALYANGNKLFIEAMTHIGLSKTYSGNDLITDSAAGATAFGCGVKTYNKAIGVAIDTTARESIMTTAHKQGLATGIIVTCNITDATPACFYAHQRTRKEGEEIAAQMPNAGLDVFLGGGWPLFAKRSDGKNLITDMEKNGYTVSNNLDAFAKSTSAKKGMLWPDADLPSILNGRGDYLTTAVPFALDVVAKNKKGFFMLVEGSQIDWGGHGNNTDYIITEAIDFDKAIGKALEFAQKDGNTLVIVTADHETGGFAIDSGSIADKKIVGKFTTGHHTGTMVPVYAYGPGAEEFSGIYENTMIYAKMMALLGLKK